MKASSARWKLSDQSWALATQKRAGKKPENLSQQLNKAAIMTNLKRSLGQASRARVFNFIAVFALTGLLAGSAPAQIFSVLASPNSLIAYIPDAPLLQGPDDTLYGMSSEGGASNCGTVFKINPDGTGLTNLITFTNGTYGTVGLDGIAPFGGVTLSGDTLYGTTVDGGSGLYGTIFSVRTDGSGFTTLYDFVSGTNGGLRPEGGVILSGNTLYGTTSLGGSNNFGTVFSINTNGTGFKSLYSFTGGLDCGNPYGPLILSNGVLYGTTTGMSSAIADYGTVFKINTNGSGYQTLVTFLNNNGANPFGGLVLSAGVLYGTTYKGGAHDNGTIFRVSANGGAAVLLHSFSALSETSTGTNKDGAGPQATLLLSSNTLYGTTEFGGPNANTYSPYGYGTVYKINTSGGAFTVLHSFSLAEENPDNETTNSDGFDPEAGVILSANTLYGTTQYGGTNGTGTIFALSLGSIPLNPQSGGSNLVLTWGNPGFSLQAASDVNGAFTNIPGATSPYTNPATGAQMFFRLAW
jgi:uncharacterized repeat protein (TIGR03803 family)